jgi:hypothetical protein
VDGAGCSACAAGTYQPTAGFTGSACTSCSSGRYAASTGSSSCVSCPAGSR